VHIGWGMIQLVGAGEVGFIGPLELGVQGELNLLQKIVRYIF